MTEVTALWRRVTGSDEGEYAVEGGEEYFDENEHVDGFAAEERSATRRWKSEGEDDSGPEGSDFAVEEGYEEDGRGPEGSDFAAEEGGPDAEEGYEELMDLVAYTHVCVRVCVCVFIIVDPLQYLPPNIDAH